MFVPTFAVHRMARWLTFCNRTICVCMYARAVLCCNLHWILLIVVFLRFSAVSPSFVRQRKVKGWSYIDPSVLEPAILQQMKVGASFPFMSVWLHRIFSLHSIRSPSKQPLFQLSRSITVVTAPMHACTALWSPADVPFHMMLSTCYRLCVYHPSHMRFTLAP